MVREGFIGLCSSALIVFAGSGIRAADFALGFEGCPAEIRGAPGEVKTFAVLVTLATTNNDSPDGVQGWYFVLGVQGGSIAGVHLDGIIVSTIFDIDGRISTPPRDPYLLDLGEAGYVETERRCTPEVWACAVVLHQSKKMVLQPTGTQTIARVTVEAVVPDAADPPPLTLTFTYDYGRGCKDGSVEPNVVTFQSTTYRPALFSCTVPFGGPPIFRRADGNGDGAMDISDAVAILGYLFLDDGEPGCRDAADTNDDGAFDITDAIFLLRVLFGRGDGSMVPAPGPYICGPDPDPRPGGCDASPSCP